MVEHLYLSPSENCHIVDLATLNSVFADGKQVIIAGLLNSI